MRTAHAVLLSLVPTLLLVSATSALARSVAIMAPPSVVHGDPERFTDEVEGELPDVAPARLSAAPYQPWTSASSIALTADDQRLVVADADHDAVVVVEAKSGRVLATVPVAERPERLVVGPDGVAWVACRLGRAVSVVDVRAGKELARLDAGVEPYAVALTPDADLAVVTASASGEVIGFDTKTRRRAFRTRLPEAWPAAVAVAPSGRAAFVTHLQSGVVDRIALPSGRRGKAMALPTDVGGPRRHLGGGMDQVVAQPGADTVATPPRQPAHANAAVVSPSGGRLYVSHLSVDTGAARAGFQSTGGYGLGAPAPLMSHITAFDLETGKAVRPPMGAATEDFEAFGELEEAAVVIETMSQPVALVHHPTHALLFQVAMGSDAVQSFDASYADPMLRPLSTLPTGWAPRGVALTRDGHHAWVHSAHEYAVERVDLDVLVSDEDVQPPRRIEATRLHVFGQTDLPASAQMGRRLFTYAGDTRVGGFQRFACASCHPDGRNDGLTWHIGDGPRQTPILAGRLEHTAPYNWLGTEHALDDNVRQTIGRLGGGGVGEKELQALASYIEGWLPGLDNPNPVDGVMVARGAEIFERPSVGCSSCHDPDGSRFTDGDSHDVGTAGAREVSKVFDTPSLRHAWASAPYLHDGQAGSLLDLLTSGNPGDRMGGTSDLDESELAALEAYLASL